MPTNDPNNQPPQIPSFKKDDKEKKGGAIPILGQGGKPALTIRGMGHGTTLMERLKQFKKKDMAFIASGLAVLLMAPLAEHFFLGPKEDPNTLKRGFDSKGNVFTDVSPYEPGTGGMSPGGLAGSNQDIITPLNVRDPSALIMGPGAQQTPSTTVSAPTTTKSDSGGWKDALVEAAKSSRDGGLPGPRENMAGALRGLSALAGSSYGGGPSYGLPPISAGNVPNRGADSSALSRVQGAPGYKGVAERGPGAGSNTLDALKKAGADQAGLFNRSGSAGANLDAAAASAIPGGGAGSDLGGPGGGEANKSPGGNQGKDSKSLGESLAFLRAKMNMEKELELYWKKREFKEFELQKTLIMELLKLGITNLAGKAILEPGSQMIGQMLFCSGGRNAGLTMCQQATTLSSFVTCTDGDEKWPIQAQVGEVLRCQGNEPNRKACPMPTTGGKDGQAPLRNACYPCPHCSEFSLGGKQKTEERGMDDSEQGAASMDKVANSAKGLANQLKNCPFNSETDLCTKYNNALVQTGNLVPQMMAQAAIGHDRSVKGLAKVANAIALDRSVSDLWVGEGNNLLKIEPGSSRYSDADREIQAILSQVHAQSPANKQATENATPGQLVALASEAATPEDAARRLQQAVSALEAKQSGVYAQAYLTRNENHVVHANLKLGKDSLESARSELAEAQAALKNAKELKAQIDANMKMVGDKSVEMANAKHPSSEAFSGRYNMMRNEVQKSESLILGTEQRTETLKHRLTEFSKVSAPNGPEQALLGSVANQLEGIKKMEADFRSSPDLGNLQASVGGYVNLEAQTAASKNAFYTAVDAASKALPAGVTAPMPTAAK